MKKLIIISLLIVSILLNVSNSLGDVYYPGDCNTVIQNLPDTVVNSTTDATVYTLTRDASRNRRGFEWWNLSNVTGKSVLSANLTLIFSAVGGAIPAINHTITYCNDYFSGDTLTWNNQGVEVINCNASAFRTNTMTSFAVDTAYVWDITSLVNNELSGDGIFTFKYMMNPESYDATARQSYHYSTFNVLAKWPYITITLAPVSNLTGTLTYPSNQTHYHLVGANISKVYNGTISMTTNRDANCTINNSLWSLVGTNTTDHGWLNNTALSDANYSIRLNCSSGLETLIKDFWFVIDTTDPNIDLMNPLNNSLQYNTMMLNISYSDLYLYRANTTIIRMKDNVTVYNNYSGDLTGMDVYYNLTELINFSSSSIWQIGRYKILMEATDTHTKKEFLENPKLTKQKVKDMYETDLDLLKGQFKIIHPLDMEILTIKEDDRIKFKHTKTKLEDTEIYIEGSKLVYFPNSNYPCHFIVNDNYWYDCVGYDNPKVIKITDNKYKIEFEMNTKEVITDSLGGLNYINKTSYFYKVNATFGNVYVGDTFSPPDANFTYTSNYNFTVTSVIMNETCLIITGSAIYDSTYCYKLNSLYLDNVIAFVNMTPVTCYANLSNLIGTTIPTIGRWFNKTDDLIQTGSTTTCEHNKDCTIDILSNTLVTFNNTFNCRLNVTTAWFTYLSGNSTTIQSDSIGVCSSPNNYYLLNITYLDEVDNSLIEVINGYDITFTDGLGTLNLQGNFSSAYNHQFCTSVDPTFATVNLNLWGDFTLTKSGYTTRILNYIPTSPILVSNNPKTNISFYLIKLNQSSVIQYTWRTTSFQFIDGTMLIYRCNDDGTKDLLSSQPVSNGFASANLQLFTIPYSYEIIIDGTTYTDASFSTCHIENVQSRSFYVDVDLIEILPAIGLFLVDCKMTKPTNTTATMTWTANPQDTSNIYGCMVGLQTTVFGETEIFRNCTNSSVGDFTRNIPNSGTPIRVIGEIYQNENKGYCQQTLNYYSDKVANVGLIGLTGLLVALFIVLVSTFILYSESGTMALVGVSLGYVFSYLLGVIIIPWSTVLAIITLAIAIGLIARYTKKSEIG